MRYMAVLLLLLFSTTVWSKTVLVIGDSISAGYGVELEDGWVNLLRQKLQQHGEHRVINASISGNTTTMGVGRTGDLLKEHQPDIVILELGGNDGLQGHPLRVTRKNLQQMIDMSQNAGARVLLVGIQIPPNYGQRYAREFADVFPSLAKQNNVALVPFILEGVATNDSLMQDDGVHPTAEAQPQLLDNVWPHLKPLLKQPDTE